MRLFERDRGLGVPFTAGFCAGIATYWFFDPRRGAARRALIRDKVRSAARNAGEQARRRAHDLEQRARGLAHEAKARVEEGPVDDDVLAERVRAQLGRQVSHPRALEVSVRDGMVTLSGPILASELEPLLERVSKVRGVKTVENRLEVHPEPGNIPALQGEGERRTT